MQEILDRTLSDELRQWSLCKTFVHQFKVMAAWIIHPRIDADEERKENAMETASRRNADTSRLRRRKRKPKSDKVVEQHGKVAPDLEADEHRAAEELTRPAVNHNRPLSGPLIS